MEVVEEQEQIEVEVDVQKLNQLVKGERNKMSLGDSMGGLLGGLLVLGVAGWGVKKMGEALDSDGKKSKSKSLLDDTEPFG